MVTRCTVATSPDWDRYGGRGIRVHAAWLVFDAFLADMGERPEGLCLDRINNDGDYEPGNCRWASTATQARNRRSSKLTNVEARFIRHWISEGYRQRDIASAFGVNSSIVSRINTGAYWSETTGGV